MRVVSNKWAEQTAELYEQIGRMKVELEWLKKSCRTRVKQLSSGSTSSTKA